MKRKMVLCIITILLFNMTGCSEETEQEVKSVAEDGLQMQEILKGCEVISDKDGLPETIENQSFNYESDYHPGWLVHTGVTDSKEQLYIMDNKLLKYFQKSSNELAILCGKPECDHTNTTDCNAKFMSSQGLQYYNGNLYTVDALAEFTLRKITPDGSFRENIGSLFVDASMVDKNSSGSSNGSSIVWIIHRGYIYYTYKYNVGWTEDTYYLNNSHYLFRMSLEGDEEPQCIMQIPYLAECKLEGKGSYVYIATPGAENGKLQFLYRFNIETKMLECIESIGDNITSCTVKDNRIYYTQKGDRKMSFLMCYDLNTKEKSKVMDIDADGTALLNILSDEDYIYVYYSKNGESEKARVLVSDWNYNIKAEIIFDYNEDVKWWGGTDEKNIYMSKTVIGEGKIIAYIEKEDLLDGEYTVQDSEYKK